MNVEIAYARPDIQVVLGVELEAGATVEQAIRRSGILTRFPEIDLARAAVGIFGTCVQLGDTVCAGDRVEIYRALTADPKDARRRRAVRRRR